MGESIEINILENKTLHIYISETYYKKRKKENE